MTGELRLWMRHESRPSERRAPITPSDAATLVERGVTLTVEESGQRSFPIEDYTAAGCVPAAAGSWVDAPLDNVVVGLKELPEEPVALRHRHILFGHAYKGQPGADRLLRRFAEGGGTLLDLEYLTDESGRRLAAFGFWAGYIGAALAVLHHRGRLLTPLTATDRTALDLLLTPQPGEPVPSAVVLGALGRSGRGAVEALTTAGLDPARWDLEQTRELDRAVLLGHELMINAVLATRPTTPFLTPADLDDPARRTTLVSDITCDVGSECNVLPVYDQTTDWDRPARRLREAEGQVRELDLIAIDNLPSLLPLEASLAFSADLLPQLTELDSPSGPWQRCAELFHRHRDAAVRAGDD